MDGHTSACRLIGEDIPAKPMIDASISHISLMAAILSQARVLHLRSSFKAPGSMS
jgi:hypothetical protein